MVHDLPRDPQLDGRDVYPFCQHHRHALLTSTPPQRPGSPAISSLLPHGLALLTLQSPLFPSLFIPCKYLLLPPLFYDSKSTRFTRMPDPQISSNGFFREPRLVVRKFLARPQHEGVGAIVRRSIGRFELKYFDPFLALDEFSVSAPAGFPDHPHRGFETVTYMLQGTVLHEDFEGHRGSIDAGDLQWMTAGRGIVHSEMPAATGVQKGLQLWINLSSKNKMIEPRYQEIKSKDIAEATKDGIKVRIIAGEALGKTSPIYTKTPTMYLDFTLGPGAHLQQPIPIKWNAFVYVLEGEGVFGSRKNQPTTAHHLLLLTPGDGLEAWNKSPKPLRFILVGGEPLGEPVAQLGPFVMNTQEEIDRTIEDYENCINGFEKAKYWRSEDVGF